MFSDVSIIGYIVKSPKKNLNTLYNGRSIQQLYDD